MGGNCRSWRDNDGMQRIDLAELEHVVTSRWQSQGAVLLYGRAGDRWFCWRTRAGAAYVSADERTVADKADRWLARGVWRKVSDQPVAAAGPSPAPRAR